MNTASNNIPKEIVERADNLKKVIETHRYNYHVLDKITMSEQALDSLKKELFDLEVKYPELITPDSPSQRVGGKPLGKFKKIKHEIPQWSFNDAFDENDIKNFEEKIKRILKSSLKKNISPEYVTELKIDGLKIVLTYEKGLLKRAVTRGDGEVGEDITENVKTIDSVPLKLKKEIDLIVEGEIFMGKKDFEELNKKRKKAGESVFANPRNAAAGSVRQLDPKIARERKLDVFIYDIAKNSGQDLETQIEELMFLSHLGFKVNKYFKLCKNLNEVINFWKKWQNNFKKEDYLIDGVVVKVNKTDYQKILGYTGKAPRFGIAFKFPAEQVTTTIEDIVFQVGRTGVITPVAKLKPVLVAGSVVSRATLHNEDEIKRLDVRIGDTVILQKAGDVIPDIVSVIKEMRTGKEQIFKFPTKIPECGGNGEIEKIPGQVAWRCKNKNSSYMNLRKLTHFVSKIAFNIDGCGPKILKQLMEYGVVVNYPDIFTLKKGDLLSLPRFAEKSAENLIEAINKKRKIQLSKLLVSLSIPQVGEETAEDLTNHFKTLKKIQNAKIEDLEIVEGVGKVVAQEIVSWFKNDFNQKNLNKLLKEIEVMEITGERGLKQNTKLLGKTFVLTGTLNNLSRTEAKNKIKQNGGKVLSVVSSKTDFVVAGKNPGSKFNQAKKLGIKIINEKDFFDLLVV